MADAEVTNAHDKKLTTRILVEIRLYCTAMCVWCRVVGVYLLRLEIRGRGGAVWARTVW